MRKEQDAGTDPQGSGGNVSSPQQEGSAQDDGGLTNGPRQLVEMGHTDNTVALCRISLSGETGGGHTWQSPGLPLALHLGHTGRA